MKSCSEPSAVTPSRSAEMARLAALNRMLEAAWAGNPFYARKWTAAGVPHMPLTNTSGLGAFPFTTRAELIADQNTAPPLGLNWIRESQGLIRHHHSSGTTHEPLLWADSAESWRWVISGSVGVWRLADVRPRDRVLFLMAFEGSSGPWIVYEGACALGCVVLPLGTADVQEQLRWLAMFNPSVLVGKPSTIGALGGAVLAMGQNPATMGVKKLILCGPSQAPQRLALESLWAAECFARYGLTEAGTVAGECGVHPGWIHLLDDHFIAESIQPETQQPASEGAEGELVLTTLGRISRPIIRYRTGDLVQLVSNHSCRCGRQGTVLVGGIRRLSGHRCSEL